MNQHVLLDSNIIVDYALKRSGFAEKAEMIFKQIEAETIGGCISSSAVTDVYYIVENKTTDDYAREMMEYIYHTLRILPVMEKTIRAALDSGIPDFEDAVQAAAAQDFGIDIVVTRDKTGYQNSGLHVYTPEEFLESLK